MRRLLVLALLALSAAGTGGSAQAVCAGDLVCVGESHCYARYNYCPGADACIGDVNFCPGAGYCAGTVNICDTGEPARR